MILDAMEKAEQYCAMHPGLAGAFEFLRTADLAALTDGRNDIDGARLYAMVARMPGRGHDGARLEVHRRYIDIQISLSGTDEIGWRSTDTCVKNDGDFNEETDAQMFDDAPDAWVELVPGTFVILFPGDAHAPLGGTGDLHKVVMKIALD